MNAPARSLRVAGWALAGIFFCLEGGCSTGPPASASSSASAPAASRLEAYERLRARAWDPSRRFKALFKAEVSPKVGAIGRGYLSVWWDGATGTLAWRASAPVAGSGRGGLLRRETGEGGAPAASTSPLPGNLAPADLIACILGTPDAAASSSSPIEETSGRLRLRIDDTNRTALLDGTGQVVEMRFPKSEVVSFEPGEGVPRRIEANGPDGRAVLTLETYSFWPAGEEFPPP